MPIDFRCPHCNTLYRLKDDLAGKTARCRTETCRKVMTIPAGPPSSASSSSSPAMPAALPGVPSPIPVAKSAAVTSSANAVPPVATSPPVAAAVTKPATTATDGPTRNGVHTAALPAPQKVAPPPRKPAAPVQETPPPAARLIAPPMDAESLALNALADEPPAKESTAPTQRILPMTCEMCEHKWSVPATMAGKNVLCPDCQRRQRVPELKIAETDNWRQQSSRLPSLAKREEGPLEGVQASTQTQSVSVDSMVQSGAIEEDLDPLPLSYRLIVRGIPIALVLVVLGLAFSWFMKKDVKKQENLMAEALKQFDSTPKESQLPAPTQMLMKANLELAAGEHEIRMPPQEGKNRLKEARDHLSQALGELRLERQKPEDRKRPDRNALLGELALVVIQLGGTPDQVKEHTRYPWVPDTTARKILKISESGQHTVHEELQRVLENLKENSDFDFRIAIARRLVRELVPRGQSLMARNVATQLFLPPEQLEAKAIIALEIQRLDPPSSVPTEIARELEAPIREMSTTKAKPPFPFPSSAQALLRTIPGEKPIMDRKVPAQGPIQEPDLRAAIVDLLSKDPGKSADALALATRSANPIDSKLTGLLQIAEWSTDPGSAFDAAASLVKDLKSLSPADMKRVASRVYRLAQLAAKEGKITEAKALADTLPTGGYREWAQGEITRQRIERSPSEPVEAVELPEDRSKWCAGHAWGRLAFARQAGRLGEDKKKFADWPNGVIKPFALAGLALGMQDKR